MNGSSPPDDELAALLALDALEADEQADAELRLGPFPWPAAGAVALLAEPTATPPPGDLRAETLRHALSRRRPGRPVDGVRRCSPVEAFERTVGDFDQLLTELTTPEWDAPAHPEHGRVRDVVAHLVGVERLMLRWLDPDDGAPDQLDHVASTRPAIEELSTADPRDVAQRWREGALAAATVAGAGDTSRPVTFHDMTTSVDGLLVMRTFELWAHAMDVAAATDRPRPDLDAERMAVLSARLMAAVPLALAHRRTPLPGRTARIVLTGPAGGVYSVPLDPRSRAAAEGGTADVTLVADTVELCRVAARRLAVDELPVTIEGDAEAAALVLAGIDAFARD